MIDITGAYTIGHVFNLPEVNEAFRQAIEHTIIPKNTKVFYISHYDIYKNLDMGNVNISGRVRDLFYTKINFRMPISVAYNREKLGYGLNLTAKHLKKIICCAIHRKIFKPWNRIPQISIGAVRGHSRHATALYTGLSYDKLAQVIENFDITRFGKNFVNELINNQEFDLVFAPYTLMKTYFYGNFDIANIDGRKPQEPGYCLNSYLLYASYNGKHLEIQKALAESLNNANLLNELNKVGIYHFTNETCIKYLYNKYPNFFEPLIKNLE